MKLSICVRRESTRSGWWLILPLEEGGDRIDPLVAEALDVRLGQLHELVIADLREQQHDA